MLSTNEVNEYNMLTFFWSKFGITRKDLENIDSSWVQIMITISNAESEVNESKSKQQNSKGG